MNFHGEKRSNETHASKTDPDAKLARQGPGKEAKLSYSGNLLVENRNELIVDAEVFEANGTAERHAALVILSVRARRRSWWRNRISNHSGRDSPVCAVGGRKTL